jgi:hypothetical protein
MKLIPERGTEICIHKDAYKEPIEPPVNATVQDILSEQFTAVGDDGRLYFIFYTDYMERFDVL